MELEVDCVSYSYGDIAALNEISFRARRGEIVGLIGENGAGKSTLIRVLYRFLVPDCGTVSLDGRDIFSLKDEEYPVSYIPDSPVFYEELSLIEHLLFTKAVYPGCSVSVDELVEALGLGEHLRMIPSALSRGTRQKLMIAMALLREYELLIADEPFTGLDPGQIAVLKGLLAGQREKGKLVLLSSHLLDVAENICSYGAYPQCAFDLLIRPSLLRLFPASPSSADCCGGSLLFLLRLRAV